MKYIIIVIIFFLSFAKNSNQDVNVTKIEYIETKRQDSTNIFWQGKFNLYRTNTTSKYSKGEVLKNNLNSERGGVEFKPKNSKTEIVYKDYIKNEMFSKDLIGFKFFNIKDSINIIKWTIKNKRQEILGYTCTLAESFFRGRTYQVWFTTQLISGGPWKLDGLPGMILRADTKDGYISFEVTKIIITKQKINKIDYANPYSLDKKFYSWKEFKIKYKEKAIRMSKYNPTDNTSFVLPRIRRERYINDDDLDYLKDNEIKESIDQTRL